jgi:hypothetical protein
VYRVLMRKPEGEKQLLNPGIDGRTLLNLILKK